LPERVVSTLLKIDGEQQYKAAIANINREQQSLKQSIKLVDEQFRGQANTMAALVEKEKLYANQQALSNQKLTAAQGMYAKAQASVAKYSEEIAKLKNYVAKDAEEQEKLKKQLETAQENFLKAQNSVVSYNKAVIAANVEVAKINNSIKDNAKYLNEAKNSANGTATSIDAFGKQTATAKKEVEGLGKNGSKAFSDLAQALVAAGLIRSVEELVDLFVQASKASNEFETAFTGVTKTVEGSPEQLAAIKEQMKALSTEIPLTASELSKIAEIAGQLGIATDDVAGFTETIAALTVSTNLSADQAATMLARFAKITDLPASEYANLGAVIVALGNNSAATESEIVDMAMGIAAAGKQVGMSQSQIMAYAASLTSAGMESQAGGSAISRTLIEMSLASQNGGAELKKFADIAGMSSEAFASLFETSASDALNSFITGLASGSESAIKALNDMGITEIRQRDAILRLANSGDLLTTSISTASTAFKENTALTEEAAKFYATTDSKIQLLKNSTNLLAITIGDQFNPAVRKGVGTLTDWTGAINTFLQKNPGMVQAVTGFAAAIGAVAVAVAGYTLVTQLAIPAITAFNTALLANPVGAVVMVLATLTATIIGATAAAKDSVTEYDNLIEKNEQLIQSMDDAKKTYDNNVSSIENERDAVETLVSKLDSLLGSQEQNKSNSAAIKNLVDQLNSAVSGLGLTYDSATGSINMTTDAIRNQTTAMYEQKLQAALVDRQVQAEIALMDAKRQHKATQDALTDAQNKANTAMSNTLIYINGQRVAIDESSIGNGAYTEEIKKLTKQEKELAQGVDDAQKEVDYYTETVTGASKATDTAASSMGDAAVSADDVTASLDALKTAWTDNRDSALDAADKIGGVLDKLDGKGKVTIDKITDSQEQQAQFWVDYATNLEKAKELGLDPNLLAQLATPTEENAQLLDSIVKGSVDKIEELNQAYEDNAKARADFADASATAKTEISNLYKTFSDDMDEFIIGMDRTEQGYASGSGTIAGIVNGLESELPTFEALIAHILALIAQVNGSRIKLPGLGSTEQNYDSRGYPKSYKTGLDYVPHDYYLNYADEGEAILTKQEAISWRSAKAAIARSTPSAAAMVAMPRQASAQDIAGAVSAAAGSMKGGNTYNSSVTLIAPKEPDAYEIGRVQRRNIRTMERNS